MVASTFRRRLGMRLLRFRCRVGALRLPTLLFRLEALNDRAFSVAVSRPFKFVVEGGKRPRVDPSIRDRSLPGPREFAPLPASGLSVHSASPSGGEPKANLDATE